MYIPQHSYLLRNEQGYGSIIDPAHIRLRIPYMSNTLTLPERPAHLGSSTRQMSILARFLDGDGLSEPQTTEFNDQTQLMLAVRDRRDRTAFGALFDYFAPRLKAFIMRSGTPAGQAEDLVQDVMLTVWHKASQFDPHRAQTSAWIYQIARNKQIDLFRKDRRPVPESIDHLAGAEPDASQILAMDQEVGHLKKALARLKPDQRAIIEKAYLGELTHQEISAMTGLPLGTIKSRIRLGLDRLRHDLKGMR